MNQHTIDKLQYGQLIDRLKEYCSSSLGREEADRVKPYKNIDTVKRKLNETTEARVLLDVSNNAGISGTENIIEIIDNVEKDMILTASQVNQVLYFLMGSRKMQNYMADKEFYAPYLFTVASGLSSMKDLTEELEESLRNGEIVSEASVTLKSIRRHMVNAEEQISDSLDKFLRNKKNQDYLQETFVSVKRGRQTIPIKAACKNKVEGTVIDSTNKTVFIEPKNVKKYTDKLDLLKVEEADEEYKILCSLTGLIHDSLNEIKMNLDILGVLDLAFAKAKYSRAIEGIEPELNEHGYINIVNGKHMLLSGNVVPLNVTVGEEYRSLIITGPNAGGKTVVLKTIGLLTMATQSGLHIPCEEGTSISVFERIFADIGDDQSIENALSTFSSHVKNLAACVNKTNKNTLLIFDEIGSGTEPTEGAALAIAILEDVYMRGAIIVATTHYNDIKDYAKLHPDFETAAMKFNKETLEPLYKLVIGKSGDSNALWISKKMGISENILKKADSYMSDKNYDLTKVKSGHVTPEEETVIYDYAVGDRVYIKTMDKRGLVYEPKDKNNMVKVYFEGEIESLHVRLITIEGRSQDLYPPGYDMNQLFVSFKERKMNKDIERGSKKTLKKIKKSGIENFIK